MIRNKVVVIIRPMRHKFISESILFLETENKDVLGPGEVTKTFPRDWEQTCHGRVEVSKNSSPYKNWRNEKPACHPPHLKLKSKIITDSKKSERNIVAQMFCTIHQVSTTCGLGEETKTKTREHDGAVVLPHKPAPGPRSSVQSTRVQQGSLGLNPSLPNGVRRRERI
jgi:hypothetical protein